MAVFTHGVGENSGGVAHRCPNFQYAFDLVGLNQNFQIIAHLWKNNGHMIGLCDEPQPLKEGCLPRKQAADIIFYVVWYNVTHGLLRFLVAHILLNIGIVAFQRLIKIELAGVHIGYEEQVIGLSRVDGCIDGTFSRRADGADGQA